MEIEKLQNGLIENLSSSQESPQLESSCDFLFIFESSCGTVNAECGQYNVEYKMDDLIISWYVYDTIDC